MKDASRRSVPHACLVLPLRVLLADAQQAFADAVAHRLRAEPDVSVTAVTTTPEATEAALRAAPVDVLLVDTELGGDEGMGVAVRARRTHPGLRVVFLSSRDDPSTAIAALRLGAAGYVSKEAGSDELVLALRSVAGDETWVSPRVLTGVLRRLLEQSSGGALTSALAMLSVREREVLACMMSGMDRAAIGRELFLSKNTVRTHTRNILAKLDVHSSLAAVSLAREAGMRPRERKEATGEG